MELRYKIDTKYKIKRKLSETDKLISFLGNDGSKDYRIFFFEKKDKSYLSDLKKLASKISKDELLYKAKDYGLSQKGIPYIAVNYEKETTLRTLINEQKIDFTLLLKIGVSLIAQIERLHRNQYLNNRIQPENIYISRNGQVRYFPYLPLDRTDLGGIIGAKNVATESYYLPPEIIKNIFADPSSDYYMLGIILYELVTGVVPYHDTQNVEIFKQHLESDPPIPGSFKTDQHETIFKYILPLLSKDPKQRSNEITPLKTQLYSFLKGEKRNWKRDSISLNDLNIEESFFQDVYGEELLRLEKSNANLNILQGSFYYLNGEEGSGSSLILKLFFRQLIEKGRNSIFLDVVNKISFAWQGICEISLQLLEIVRQHSEEKYDEIIAANHFAEFLTCLQNKEICLSEKMQFEVKFVNLDISLGFIQLFREIAIWSPFTLLISNFHLLDKFSKKIILELGRYLPELPVMIAISSVEAIQNNDMIQDLKTANINRSNTIKLIQKYTGADDQEALIIYNKITIKAGSNLFSLVSYLNMINKNDIDDMVLPSSVYVLVKDLLKELNPLEIEILHSLMLQSFPMPLAYFSGKQLALISKLEKKKIVNYSFYRSSLAIKFNHSHVRDILISLDKPYSVDNKKIRTFVKPQLNVRPWMWNTYLGHSDVWPAADFEPFFYAIDYYTALGSLHDSIHLLDKLLNVFLEFKSHNDINHRYLKLYTLLGSYEVALSYLQLIKPNTQEEKISLMLHKISLFLKMDQISKAEKLIESVENENNLSEGAKAELRLSIADLLLKEDNIDGALSSYSSARSLFIEVGDSLKSVEVSEKMIDLYIRLGKLDEALEQIQFIYSSPLAEQDSNTLFRLLKREGDIYFWKEDLVKAAEIYQRAFNISIKEDSTPLYPDFLLNQGKLQWLVGDNNNALSYFSNAYKIYNDNSNSTGKIKSLGNQAVVYRELGNYGKALAIEIETYNLTRVEKDIELEIVSLNNLGQIYTDINQLSKAKSAFSNSSDLSIQNKNWSELYRSYLGLSSVSMKQNLLAEGKNFLQMAAQQLANIVSESLKNDIYYYWSRIDLYASRFTSGKKNINKFLDDRKISFKHQALGKVLLGELTWKMGNFAEALDILSEAFNIARLAGSDPVMQKALWLKSQIHSSLNELAQAKSALEHSVLLVYKIADTFENEIDRLMYVEAMEFAELFEAYKNR